MASNNLVQSPYPVYADTNGTPLENGYIYIGAENQNPITNPINVYWDIDLQYPAAQPIRTVAGSPNRNGSPASVYCTSPYSVIVKNKNGIQVYSSQTSNVIEYGDSENIINDGDFELNEYQYSRISTATKIYKHYGNLIYYSTYPSPADTISFIETDEQIYGNPKYYANVYSHGATSDETFIAICVENLAQFKDRYITLSFWAKSSMYLTTNTDMRIETYFQTKRSDLLYDVVGNEYHDLTTNWKKYTTTIKIEIDESLTLSAGNCLIAFISVENTDNNNDTMMSITNIKLEFGTVSSDYDNIPYSEKLNLFNRYHETNRDLDAGQTGYITYLTPAAVTVIPGLLFRSIKRTSSPDVQIQSYDFINDEVTVVFVGNISVSTVNDISSKGFGTITLASSVADQNYIYYYYTVRDYLKLPTIFEA